jgi:hypothetical protein
MRSMKPIPLRIWLSKVLNKLDKWLGRHQHVPVLQFPALAYTQAFMMLPWTSKRKEIFLLRDLLDAGKSRDLGKQWQGGWELHSWCSKSGILVEGIPHPVPRGYSVGQPNHFCI